MTYITSSDLPAWFTRTVVGADTLVDTLVNRNNTNNYPPHDLVQESENDFKLIMALAGFTKDELRVELDGKRLTVSTVPEEEKERDEHLESDYPKFIHKGIAKRSFSRLFTLVDFIVVKDVYFENGLLTITLRREIPEELKPRTIEIK